MELKVKQSKLNFFKGIKYGNRVYNTKLMTKFGKNEKAKNSLLFPTLGLPPEKKIKSIGKI